MKARVNLTIDETLLTKVKRYASKRQSSLSELVETYFKTVVDVPSSKSLIDMVEELPASKLRENKDDLKKRYMEENAQKYGF